MKRLPIDFVRKMNVYGQEGLPFLFLIDFEMQCPEVHLLSNLPDHIKYEIGDTTPSVQQEINLEPIPESFEDYKDKFDQVLWSINKGDSYLLNLTCRTPVLTSCTLDEIYKAAYARYKLLYKNRFVCFSPEPFVQIKENTIFSYPMKGTIDASIPYAKDILSNNPKELAEHYTIVDLIRNDLSRIATEVHVDDFRYTETINSNSRSLLQQSTSILGSLASDWSDRIGDIFDALLPAGSISGAPKQKTIEIIRDAEGGERGFYTGVFGVFDGSSLDSGVMIRYVEKENEQYFFRSGGGITHLSSPKDEYQEMIDKIYVPIFREHQGSKSTDLSPAISYQ